MRPDFNEFHNAAGTCVKTIPIIECVWIPAIDRLCERKPDSIIDSRLAETSPAWPSEIISWKRATGTKVTYVIPHGAISFLAKFN